MIAGIKLVYAISSCPYISDEDKIKALDDIIDMVKTEYITHSLTDDDGVFIDTTQANRLLSQMFWWRASNPGYDFWNKIYNQLREANP
jgi:hypothetical protein